MRYRRRLRSRIILSFFLLGFGLTGLFAVATVLLREQLEDQLIGEALVQNVDDYAEQFYRDPEGAGGLPFEKITGIVYSERRFGNVPFNWRDLPDGVHDVTETDERGRSRTYKLAVKKDDDYWFFLSYDIAQERASQQQLTYALVGVVALFSVLSLVIGVWSSKRVISPVTELARRLERLAGREQPEKLAPHFAQDEVGQLAAALDGYAERMTTLVKRDREFNSDVSHELRTPLAVIRGATELMLANPDLAPKMRQRLERVDRAAQQCTDLTTALLMLSRNERGTGRTYLLKLSEQLAEAARTQLGGKPVTVLVEGDAAVEVEAPEAVLAVALGNLVGNACKYTSEGEVRIVVEAGQVRIEDTGPGLSEEDAARLFERGYRGSGAGGTIGGGIGLSIVRRLCELYGWTVSIAPRPERGAVAILRFVQT
ncbi:MULTISPECIES: HAMP domain-containing sensor histidine kinase [unclassified Arenimonas]|uniref:sensor histidine kinase n=1 Tax=unclassified Arenimonas TaxID=2641713 RepID=UPI000869088D|nr:MULTISPECIES: HAMP domain-containing sensor histidine kinase [unclassified Arenimonas]ODS64524.1 MAG: two-component sensor histidine kinase [Arenimonas sp. SCN 70-307]